MSRLTDLISKVKASDAELGKELEREFKTLSARLPFGLNFERHSPETVELPGRPVRKGDKVRILPPRGSNEKSDRRLYRVVKIKRADGKRIAEIERVQEPDGGTTEVSADDLIVVAEFRDFIYPGLVSTGKVERGGDKPFHTVINAENYHALEALTFTHRGRIDAIYIDPPYNTGARDWKYNNDYVEGDDIYRHSKWLAMMERRLLVARDLLNPEYSVLIVTIDEKEYLRLGLLLQQVFSGAPIQMTSIVINSQGVARKQEMSRVDEYMFCVYVGTCGVPATRVETLQSEDAQSQVGSERIWFPLIRGGRNGTRERSWRAFYPIFVDDATGRIESVGEPLPLGQSRDGVATPKGQNVVWPISRTGAEGCWQMVKEEFLRRLEAGYIRVGRRDSAGRWPVTYIRDGLAQRIEAGELTVVGRDQNGALEVANQEGSIRPRVPKTVWYQKSHNAGTYGTGIYNKLVPDRYFPFPKSLYTVEDVLRMFTLSKKNAKVLDFFAGTGTTAHAVMRLNKQDGGRRQCISITNNEVAADEQKRLSEQGLRPGDPDWEKWGICDYITKPRIEAAITGKTPDGEPIKGDYKFTDEFPMAEGFEENAEFFTLTYETPVAVGHNHAFARIAPLLWMRAGSTGKRIDKEPSNGWAVVETYGLLTDLDQAGPFEKAIEASKTVRIAYIVTDDERRFQSIAQRLPHTVEPIRLYEAYLTNFRFAVGR